MTVAHSFSTLLLNVISQATAFTIVQYLQLSTKESLSIIYELLGVDIIYYVY